MEKREVHVLPFRSLDVVSKDERLIAVVRDLQDKIAVAEAIARPGGKPLRHPRTGIILARRGDTLDDMVGVGDLIVVGVSSIFNGLITFDLTCPGCGCILAACSQCGGQMERKGPLLECSKCGRRERRRLALKYGYLDYYLKDLVRGPEDKNN
jgi:exosome complex RNA-binding protein Csl4